MDARPLLDKIAHALGEARLEAILIGNAAAALHGAPVSTVDLDFMVRRTPRNLAKLKIVAKMLDAVMFRPYYPASNLVRLIRDDDGLQLDFMTSIDGVRSYESLRAKSAPFDSSGQALLIASPRGDSTKQTRGRAAQRQGRTRYPGEGSLLKKRKRVTRKETLAALKKETDRELVDMIRRLLAKPLNERTHFLRKRVGFRGSCL
jgi:hypothetical protein